MVQVTGSLTSLLMGLIPALIRREVNNSLQDRVLGKLWGEEPVLCSYLFAPHSRRLLSLGCKSVVFLLQAPNRQWSLQQKPSIPLHSLTQLAEVAFQILRCLIISLDLILKNLTQT